MRTLAERKRCLVIPDWAKPKSWPTGWKFPAPPWPPGWPRPLGPSIEGEAPPRLNLLTYSLITHRNLFYIKVTVEDEHGEPTDAWDGELILIQLVYGSRLVRIRDSIEAADKVWSRTGLLSIQPFGEDGERGAMFMGQADVDKLLTRVVQVNAQIYGMNGTLQQAEMGR